MKKENRKNIEITNSITDTEQTPNISDDDFTTKELDDLYGTHHTINEKLLSLKEI